MNQINIMF